MGSCSSGGRGNSKSNNKVNGNIKGNVSFEKIISASDNSLSLTGSPTIFKKVGKNVVVVNAKKSTMGEVLNKMEVKDFVVNSYAGKKFEKDLQRLNKAGFEAIAWNIGTKDPSSSMPPQNYYYMRKRG